MMRKTQGNRLRKQPKMRRVQAGTAVSLPHATVPKTAKKRRRRQQTEPIRASFSVLRRLVFTSRWISLALLALCLYATYLIAQERRYFLTYIPVEGSSAVAPETIAAASGLAGQHIFAADPAAAAAQINELPGIISATVTLRWPNQVTIRVAEESPVAIWLEGGKEYGVTATGRLIEARFSNPRLPQIVSELPAPQVPVPTPVAGLTPSGQAAAPATDEQGEPEQEQPPTALAYIPPEILEGALQLRRLQPSLPTLYYRPNGGLSFDDSRGWRAYFGTGLDMNQKLVVYETIAAGLLEQGIQPVYISVSNQYRPYYATQ
jgi:hypothetical protein